jgi:PTS system ascorbate-specific IIC component
MDSGPLGVLLFFINQILTQPYLIMGVVTLVGMVLLKKSIPEVFTSTMKTMFGFIILFLGVGGMVPPIINMARVVNDVLGVTGIGTGTSGPLYHIVDPVPFTFVGSTVLISAFLLQLLVARFTRWKYVYIVGNMMPGAAYGLAFVFSTVIQDPIQLILICTPLVTAYWTIGPAIVNQWDKEWIPGGAYTLGHCQYIGEIAGGYLGPYIGDAEKESSEKIQFPGWLSILSDNTILNAVILLIMWIILGFLAGPVRLAGYAGGTWEPLWLLKNALDFTCGLTVILFGVRIQIGELTVAFEGFRERIVPGAIPAYDCPTVYPYGPQAVTLGFLSHLVGQVAGTLTLALSGFPVIAMPQAFLFFDGATIGVYTDKRGGWKAVLLIGVVTGIIGVWCAALAYNIYPEVLKSQINPGSVGGNLDQSVIHCILLYLLLPFRTIS